jgi:hypothetical protein
MLKTIVIISFALLLDVAQKSPANADITRGCKAIWEVRYTTETKAFGQFSAKGNCRGKAWANDCRRAARSVAQQCFWGHWGDRFNVAVNAGQHSPNKCAPTPSSGRNGIETYSVRNLKQAIEQNACSLNVATSFRVNVFGQTWGDAGCGGEVLISGYDITDNMCGKR